MATTLIPQRYALDMSGVNPNNTVSGELHTLENRVVRVIAPAHAPFFKASLKIRDENTHALLSAAQYRCLSLVPMASALAGVGKEVYAVIAVTDQHVSPNVSVSYQTIGGDYVQSFETTVALIESLTTDTRPVIWPNIVNRPDLYEPSQHLHAVGDAVGFEHLVVELEKLRMAILMGDQVCHDELLTYFDQQVQAMRNLMTTFSYPAFHHMDTTSNPHDVTKAQVGLGSVGNYGIATVADITTASPTALKYVTNHIMNDYLDGLFAQYGTSLDTAVGSIRTNANSALSKSDTALSQATAAQGIATSLNTRAAASETLARNLMQSYIDGLTP